MELPRKFLLLTSGAATDLSSSVSEDPRQEEEEGSLFWLPFADNASLRCPTTTTTARQDHYGNDVCEEQSIQKLLWRVLYWIKRVVLRLTHSYHADTAVLLLLPLVTGILIGIYIARRMGKRTAGEHKRNKRNMTSILWGWCPTSLLLWICNLCGPTLGLYPLGKDTAANKNTDNTNTARKIRIQNRNDVSRTDDGSSLLQLLKAADDNCTSKESKSSGSFPKTPEELVSREAHVRSDLTSDRDTLCESGIPESDLPRHIAFVMDGNRRYGRKTYGNTVAGHWDGSRKVLDVAKWCIAEKIPYATVYAFSTENWKRDPAEVASLMEIFAKYCEELRQESLERNIRVRILSTDKSPIPPHVAAGLKRLQDDTECCTGLCLNVCLSYGSRSEMVQVCRRLAAECMEQGRDPTTIQESDVAAHLLTKDSPDPDVLIRTSGEMRISNYLLWQLAYAELFFLDKNWPELEKDDFLDVIRSFSCGRKRRFGK